MSAYLVTTRFGRVVLHLMALARDGKVEWHMAGVMREVYGT